MKNDANTEDVLFPSNLELRKYQQIAHKLRSLAVAGSWRLVSEYLKNQWVKLKLKRLQRKTVVELDKLDSFMLKDIGVTQADIEQLRSGSISVEAINEYRSSRAQNRISVNNRMDLEVCQCNAKVMRSSMAENSMLAKCG